MGKNKKTTPYDPTNSMDLNFCEPSWLKKRKMTQRIADKDFQEQKEAADTLMLLKYGHNGSDKQVDGRQQAENLHPNSELPLDFKTKIHELTGLAEEETEVIFVYEKTLFKSDVSAGENRFLIPFKKIKNEFLTEEERRELGTKTRKGGIPKMEVELIQPGLEVCSINLKKWSMGESSKNNSKKKKNKKKTSENYVLVTSWNKVVEVNELTIGSIVQLWSFRKGGQLCFALVKKDSD